MDDYLEIPSADLTTRLNITRQTYLVAVTRGLVVDKELIPALLATDAPYIGLIGSRRRWAMTAQALVEQGISQDALARIHAPIGLELRAETPKEIALSILAEIVKVQRGGTGEPMQWPGTTQSTTQP
jgi:xanthine dehydrogenase accessory factor